MKKIILFLLLIGFAYSLFGQSVSDFMFKEENSGITITGYKGSIKNVVIPEKINGLPVINIGKEAFMDKELTGLILPNSLITIDEAAFACNELKSITFPNSITIIGDGAFTENNLTSITLPNSLITIGEEAFSSNQLKSITLPNSLTTIGDGAFTDNQLTSVIVPFSVKRLYHVFDENVKILRQ